MTWYVVDGMDGSGKSTAADVLVDKLESEGRKVLRIEHPNRTTRLGRLEARLLLVDGKAALVASTALYVADVVRSVWRMKRARGFDDVVFVRYIMAVAYLPDDLAGMAYRIFANVLPTPDVRILVDVDPETAMRRIESRGEELERFESPEKLEKVRGRMLRLSDGWIVVDNSGSPEESADGIRAAALGKRRPGAAHPLLTAASNLSRISAAFSGMFGESELNTLIGTCTNAKHPPSDTAERMDSGSEALSTRGRPYAEATA